MGLTFSLPTHFFEGCRQYTKVQRPTEFKQAHRGIDALFFDPIFLKFGRVVFY